MPKLSVILRKSYGQAYLNMGGGRNSDEVAAWPTAEISFMDPRFARARSCTASSPASRASTTPLAEMDRDSEPWDAASVFAVQAVIRPQETRDYLIRMLDVHRVRADQRRRPAPDARLADELLRLERREGSHGNDTSEVGSHRLGLEDRGAIGRSVEPATR